MCGDPRTPSVLIVLRVRPRRPTPLGALQADSLPLRQLGSPSLSSTWVSGVGLSRQSGLKVPGGPHTSSRPNYILKLMSIESVLPSNHLIPCPPLLLPPSIFPSIRVFSSPPSPFSSLLNSVLELLRGSQAPRRAVCGNLIPQEHSWLL